MEGRCKIRHLAGTSTHTIAGGWIKFYTTHVTKKDIPPYCPCVGFSDGHKPHLLDWENGKNVVPKIIKKHSINKKSLFEISNVLSKTECRRIIENIKSLSPKNINYKDTNKDIRNNSRYKNKWKFPVTRFSQKKKNVNE